MSGDEITMAFLATHPLPHPIEAALLTFKDPEMAAAMRLFAIQLDVQHKENLARLDAMEKNQTAAFPGGDAEAHCRAHEAWIKKVNAQTETWNDIKRKGLMWTLGTGLTAGASLLVVGFVQWLRDHLK